MSTIKKPANIERLRAHLAKNSLAEKLVDNYRDSDPTERIATLKKIAEERLLQIRSSLTTKDVTPDASD